MSEKIPKTKLATKFLVDSISHIFNCRDEQCESYWTTVYFLNNNGYSTKPNDLKELIESLGGSTDGLGVN